MIMPVKRQVVAACVVGLAAASISVVTASQAQAYSGCSSSSASFSDGSAAMSITVQRGCSDHMSHIFGSVSDVKCDGRAAHGTIKFWNGDHPVAYRIESPSATNGCGTSATFRYGSTNSSPHICAFVVAYNGGPSQSHGASKCL